MCQPLGRWFDFRYLRQPNLCLLEQNSFKVVDMDYFDFQLIVLTN